MTLAEQWKAEGERKVLRNLLALKFGPLPDAVAARLEQAGEDQLSLRAERILSATSLDEVFA